MFRIFPRYRFNNPQTDQNIFVGKASYFWAGIFGFAYVTYKGMRNRAAYAFLINIGFAVLALALTAISIVPRVPTAYAIIILIAAVPIIIAVQGTMMIRIVRDGYRKKGWKVRANE